MGQYYLMWVFTIYVSISDFQISVFPNVFSIGLSLCFSTLFYNFFLYLAI